ncbi:hypothetical protein [Streptomyces sp. NPDC097981]|uniref:effector-associated constant component EACC1 n=1 Tax=Streptomyces sp. NPDC097981 TaxID=3155428 RepID=UPI00332437E5
MDVRVGLAGDETGEELRRLEEWLRRDQELGGVTITAQRAPDQGGEMGPVTEALHLLLEPRGVLTAVAASLGTWAGIRRRHVRIRVSNGKKTVEIDASRLDDPDEVAVRIVRELDGP